MPYNPTKEENTLELDPLPLDPEQPKRDDLKLLEPFDKVLEEVAQARLMIAAMEKSIADQEQRVNMAGLSLANLATPRKIKYDLDVPPACNETLLGLQAFRAGIPALRICFRNGRWSGVAAWCRLTLARLWCRPVAAIDVARDWKTVRAYR